MLKAVRTCTANDQDFQDVIGPRPTTTQLIVRHIDTQSCKDGKLVTANIPSLHYF